MRAFERGIGAATLYVSVTSHHNYYFRNTFMRILLDKQIASGIIGALRGRPVCVQRYQRGRLRVVRVII